MYLNYGKRMSSYLSTVYPRDFTGPLGPGDSYEIPKGAAGVAWWKQALSVGGDILNVLMPQLKAWLGTAGPTDQKSLTDAIAAMGIATSAQMAELQRAAQTQTWIMIGLLGAAVVGGFYFLNKKSRVATPAVKVRA